jgi:hypothetical protein
MKPFDPVFPLAALNSLQASRWTIFMAKLFGEKVVGADGDYQVVAYKWRGKLYFTDCGKPN